MLSRYLIFHDDMLTALSVNVILSFILPFRYDSSRTIHSYTNDIPFWIIPVSKSSLKDAKSNLVEVKEFARADRLDLVIVYSVS